MSTFDSMVQEGGQHTLVMMTEADLNNLARRLILDTKQELESVIAEGKSDRLVSIDEAAVMLGVSRSTLWKWNKKGYLKHIEVGGKRRYRMSDINTIMMGKH